MIEIETNIEEVIGQLDSQFDHVPEMQAEVARGLAIQVLHYIQAPPPEGCPHDTGTLSRNHFVRMAGLSAELYTPIYYWIYVVFGHKTRGGARHSTSMPTHQGKLIAGGQRFVAGNDYPGRALNKVMTSGDYEKIVEDNS